MTVCFIPGCEILFYICIVLLQQLLHCKVSRCSVLHMCYKNFANPKTKLYNDLWRSDYVTVFFSETAVDKELIPSLLHESSLLGNESPPTNQHVHDAPESLDNQQNLRIGVCDLLHVKVAKCLIRGKTFLDGESEVPDIVLLFIEE